MNNLRTAHLIIFLVIAFFNNAKSQEVPKTFDENYAKALAVFDSKRYDETVEILTRALKTEESKPAYYILRGNAFFELGRFHNAAADYTEAQRSNADYALLPAARAQARLENYEKSLFFLEAYLNQKEKVPLAKIKLDPAFSELSKTKPWTELINKKHYKTFEEELDLAEYYLSVENITEAFSLVNNRIDRTSKIARAYRIRGDIYKYNRQYKKALKDYSKAVELDSESLGYYLRRANLHDQTGDYEKAAKDYELILSLAPNSLKYLKPKAYAEYRAEQFEQALFDLLRYEEFFGESGETLYLRGEIYMANGNGLDALKVLNRCIEDDASDYRYFRARAKAYSLADMPKRALNDLGMALDLHPCGELYYLRAQIRIETGNIEGACLDIKMAERYNYYKASDLRKSYCR